MLLCREGDISCFRFRGQKEADGLEIARRQIGMVHECGIETFRENQALVWCIRNTFAQVGEQFAGLARRDDESYREYFEQEQRRQRREWPLNGVNLFLIHHTSSGYHTHFAINRYCVPGFEAKKI